MSKTIKLSRNELRKLLREIKLVDNSPSMERKTKHQLSAEMDWSALVDDLGPILEDAIMGWFNDNPGSAAYMSEDQEAVDHRHNLIVYFLEILEGFLHNFWIQDIHDQLDGWGSIKAEFTSGLKPPESPKPSEVE